MAMPKITQRETQYHTPAGEGDGRDKGLAVSRLHFHPHRRLLVAQTLDRALSVWNLDGEADFVHKASKKSYVGATAHCRHELGWIWSFHVHPGGDRLATGGTDRTLRVWNWEGDRPGEKPETVLENAHDGWVETVCYSPDGHLLATGGSDGTLRLRDARSLKVVAEWREHVRPVRETTFAPDGRRLVSACEGGLLKVWDVSARRLERTIEFGLAHGFQGQFGIFSGACSVSIAADGRLLAACSPGENGLRVFRIEDGELVAVADKGMDVAFHNRLPLLMGGQEELWVWSVDADKLQPVPRDHNGRVRAKAEPGRQFARFSKGRWARGLAVAPGGRQFALAGVGDVRLFDVEA